uniref:Protein kinase AMP-activated non-catalytic subunit beta 2 n=1 Tax=Suricata suricatta TaxID=37032 RepID=A0A673TT05_SURSU
RGRRAPGAVAARPQGTRAGWASRPWPCSHFRRKPGSLARGAASISITLLAALSAEQPSHWWQGEEGEPRRRWPPTRAAAMGNTTSDRVAGERHGAKAARAEGAGGHAPGKEHKIMVGSTDDPSVFSLPDSKVSVPHAPSGSCCSGPAVSAPPPSVVS